MTNMDFKAYLQKIASGAILTEQEAENIFAIMMAGEATNAQMAAFLMGLRVRGEAASEMVGAARAMIAKMTPLMLSGTAQSQAFDIVGTGGDKSGSYNISTTTAFVLAACGVKIAKHGNRAASSKSGSADILTALGFNLDADFATLIKSYTQANFCFMLAGRHHSAVRHVMPTRTEMGIPTLFNFLGPLCNPARVQYAMIGCFDPAYVMRMAETLKNLGMQRALIINGAGDNDTRIDEVSIAGATNITALHQGEITQYSIIPEDAGLKSIQHAAIKGGSAQENADAMLAILKGVKNDYRDIVLMNAAVALTIAPRLDGAPIPDLKQAAMLAADAIDSGKALNILEQAKALTNG